MIRSVLATAVVVGSLGFPLDAARANYEVVGIQLGMTREAARDLLSQEDMQELPGGPGTLVGKNGELYIEVRLANGVVQSIYLSGPWRAIAELASSSYPEPAMWCLFDGERYILWPSDSQAQLAAVHDEQRQAGAIRLAPSGEFVELRRRCIAQEKRVWQTQIESLAQYAREYLSEAIASAKQEIASGALPESHLSSTTAFSSEALVKRLNETAPWDAPDGGPGFVLKGAKPKGPGSIEIGSTGSLSECDFKIDVVAPGYQGVGGRTYQLEASSSEKARRRKTR